MIIALVMAGGKGLRLESDIEKPLFPINDKPLITYVLDNIKESKLIEKTVVAVSPNDPNTKKFLEVLLTIVQVNLLMVYQNNQLNH